MKRFHEWFDGEVKRSYEEAVNISQEFIDLSSHLLEHYTHKSNGHDRQHIVQVVLRAKKLAEYRKLSDKNIELVILGALCHDISKGWRCSNITNTSSDNINARHHLLSASFVMGCLPIHEYLKFNILDILTVAECCAFHRSSNKDEAVIKRMNLISSIVADADKDIAWENVISRVVKITFDQMKEHVDCTLLMYESASPELEEMFMNLVEKSVDHIEDKFSRNGYQRFLGILPEEWRPILSERYEKLSDRAWVESMVKTAALVFLEVTNDTCGIFDSERP